MKADVSMDLTAWLLGLAKHIYVVHRVCCDVRASGTHINVGGTDCMYQYGTCTVRYSTGTIQYRYRTVQYIYMVPFRNRRTEVVPKSINFPGLY